MEEISTNCRNKIKNYGGVGDSKRMGNVNVDKFKVGKYRIEKNSGQATLEFILIIPLLILVILAVSQLGYMVYVQNILEQAAREGCRIISTTNSNQKAFEQVKKICSGLDRNRLDVKITPVERIGRKVGDVVLVDITYKYNGFSNLIRVLMGKDVLLHVNSSMRMECY